MRTLVFLSGGLDSVALLYHLLKTTDDEITAVRLDMRHLPGMSEAENEAETIACHDVVSMLQLVRPFNFIHGQADEWPAHRAYATYALRTSQFHDRAVTGRNAEDSTAKGLKIRAETLSIFPAMQFPVEHLGKAHFLAMLPKFISDASMSCSRPTVVDDKWHRCGGCRACKRIDHMRDLLARGCDPDLILDFVLRKKQAGKYRRETQ